MFEGDLSNQNGLFPAWNGHNLLSNSYRLVRVSCYCHAGSGVGPGCARRVSDSSPVAAFLPSCAFAGDQGEGEAFGGELGGTRFAAPDGFILMLNDSVASILLKNSRLSHRRASDEKSTSQIGSESTIAKWARGRTPLKIWTKSYWPSFSTEFIWGRHSSSAHWAIACRDDAPGSGLGADGISPK